LANPLDLQWLPPEPPKDWQTRMREAFSDKNIRYYAGPGFSQFLENLSGLTPVLPGSGMMESTQDANEARREFESGNYGKAAAHLVEGTANVGLDMLPGGKAFLSLFGGIGARTFPWAMRPIAEAMEKAGKSVDEIWRAAGLERDAMGHWRFDISDKGYRVNPNAGSLGSDGFRVGPLFDLIHHPGARDAYPHLASALAEIRLDPHGTERLGNFAPGLITIQTRLRQLLSRLGIHELQHMVDHLEGAARGGSTWEFRQLGYSKEEADALYGLLAGEINARNAEKWLGMTPAQRLHTAPIRTEGIPRDQQIIRLFGQPY
jgi:hypothetical protein